MMPAAANIDELFDRRITFPDPEAGDRLDALVGIDSQKKRLEAEITLRVHPEPLNSWFRNFHPAAQTAQRLLRVRPPLVVLAGDVGCGKTALAESIGHAVARNQRVDITLLPLSLSNRGQGRVGEMTQLLTRAFDFVLAEGRKVRGPDGGGRAGRILLIDEADALAQSREEVQMHHEDRAGVNSLIRGVDRIAEAQVPVVVVMCTNRPGALDPAIRRRAADILIFARPDDDQRFSTLKQMLDGFCFSDDDVQPLVVATGKTDGRNYGFTFSDIAQRLIPAIVLDAYPKATVSPSRAVQIAQNMVPTAPFRERSL